MSSAEKEKVLKDWKKFIESDFSRAKFTKKLYNYLTLHCSFIAHFNQQGFYSSYFEDPEDTLKFLKQFDRDYGCKSVEYGMDYWITDEDYRDINSAMVNTFEPYKSEIYPRLKQRAREIKLVEIERLKKEIEKLI
jgi:hypothetical protein